MFSRSLFLSLLLVAACNSPSAAPPSPPPKPVASVTPAPKSEPAAAAPQPTAPAQSAPIASAPKGSSLTVKRFVVAANVENREPLQVDSVELGQLPLFAFAELANDGGRNQVVITFEREGSSETVGHVELGVPAVTKRWRTWGKTKLIDKPGRWSAVLRDGSGKELARTPFEVVAAAGS